MSDKPKLKDSLWVRHFLMCHTLATRICSERGWNVGNFVELIIESEKGRFGNDQMTVYFNVVDEWLSELHSDDAGQVFDILEDEGYSMEYLSQLTLSEIENYHQLYCVSHIDFFKTI